MKYIKKFEAVDPYKVINAIEYLKDIFQELIDLGYSIDFYKGKGQEIKILFPEKLTCVITHYGEKSDGFDLIEIRDCVQSSIGYMKSIGGKLSCSIIKYSKHRDAEFSIEIWNNDKTIEKIHDCDYVKIVFTLNE